MWTLNTVSWVYLRNAILAGVLIYKLTLINPLRKAVLQEVAACFWVGAFDREDSYWPSLKIENHFYYIDKSPPKIVYSITDNSTMPFD